MKKLIIIPFILVSLTGCDTYLRERHDSTVPPAPEGCVTMFKHTEGNEQTSDVYKGVYCKADS